MNVDTKIKSVEGGVHLRLYIQTRASKSEWIGEFRDGYKLRIKAPPVEGKANAEILAFLGKTFGLAKSKLAIVHGDLSKCKTVFIPLSYSDVTNVILNLVQN